MTYLQTYSSPLGELLLAADETGLTGAWFEGQKYFARTLTGERIEREMYHLEGERGGKTANRRNKLFGEHEEDQA